MPIGSTPCSSRCSKRRAARPTRRCASPHRSSMPTSPATTAMAWFALSATSNGSAAASSAPVKRSRSSSTVAPSPSSTVAMAWASGSARKQCASASIGRARMVCRSSPCATLATSGGSGSGPRWRRSRVSSRSTSSTCRRAVSSPRSVASIGGCRRTRCASACPAVMACRRSCSTSPRPSSPRARSSSRSTAVRPYPTAA